MFVFYTGLPQYFLAKIMRAFYEVLVALLGVKNIRAFSLEFAKK